jgi:hypothetical protein
MSDIRFTPKLQNQLQATAIKLENKIKIRGKQMLQILSLQVLNDRTEY